MGHIAVSAFICFVPKPFNKEIGKEMEKIVNPILSIRDVCVSYNSETMAVKHVSADIDRNTITAIMGPSGCGKSTLLRAVNRIHELYRKIKTTGDILLEGENILNMEAMLVRRRIGMVFQQPNPFPTMSIYDNVLAGYTLNGIRLSKSRKDEIVENNLRNVSLWDEVKDSLTKRGTFLSGGQQQRLCIARSLALQPDLLLMDEPTSALDPIATKHIESLLDELKKEVTILIVTHNMSQAKRVADHSMFMFLGDLVEYGETKKMFDSPEDPRTKAYLTGQMG